MRGKFHGTATVDNKLEYSADRPAHYILLPMYVHSRNGSNLARLLDHLFFRALSAAFSCASFVRFVTVTAIGGEEARERRDDKNIYRRCISFEWMTTSCFFSTPIIYRPVLSLSLLNNSSH